MIVRHCSRSGERVLALFASTLRIHSASAALAAEQSAPDAGGLFSGQQAPPPAWRQQVPQHARSAPAGESAAQVAPPTSGFAVLDPSLPLPQFSALSTPKRERRPAMPLSEALALVKKRAHAKFDESVEVAMNLGIDTRRGDSQVRGAVMLPHGTGRSVRVGVFATGEAAEAAKAAGADVVGAEELVASIQESGGSALPFDKALATPDMMPKLARIARILGPRGLMPNPKLGTIVAPSGMVAAIAATKAGRVEYRADKGGVLHAGIGRVSFAEEALRENLVTLASAVVAARPKRAKGANFGGYVQKVTLSSTHGPGVPVQLPSIATFVDYSALSNL
ncbi:hypothetical protein WJX81_001108 [Elliptochloris bilobata]|uniref:Ribosomal protein n=1 Tax=Elliptochloris bilobata TaxID=381761 RepID=A0AAW1QY24_9CHLO